MPSEADLRSFLSRFFDFEFYADAITAARAAVAAGEYPDWPAMAAQIRERAFPAGQPLHLVQHGANQALDENTDDEAYAWLDKMVENVERTDGVIDEY